MVALLQFRLPGVAMLATGGVVFCAAVAVAVEVQPLAFDVTARLYAPAALTTGFCRLEV